MLELRDASTAGDVAEAIVRAHIAPNAATGWVSRKNRAGAPNEHEDRWEVSLGGDTGAFFDLASLTKPMTALAIARSGLDRAAPLGDVLPEVRGTPAGDASIELLLAHRAGLEAHVKLWTPLLEGRRVDASAAIRVAATSRRAEIDASPEGEGAPPVYSDVGYLLAGLALARHVGARDAGEAIEGLVVRPLGLVESLGTARALAAAKIDFHARVIPTEDVAWRGGVIRGVVHDENAFALTGEGGSGHAGMFGTLEATLAFARAAHEAIAHEGFAWLVRERPGGSLRAGFDGKSPEGSSAGSIAGARTFGHLGFTGTSLWIDPDAESAVVVLTNRVHPTRENTLLRAARPALHDALWTLAARGQP